MNERSLLAIDCSTRGGSIAIGSGDGVLAERLLPPGPGASSLLMPELDEAMRSIGLSPRDLGGVVCGGGPGSFTGLRIAAATAKALVRTLDLPLLAFSGLLATAATLRARGRPVAALFDARNREVFAGCWSFAEGGVHELLSPRVLAVDELAAALGTSRPLLCGDGAEAYGEALAADFGEDALVSADVEQQAASPAAGLLWLTAVVPELGGVADPSEWEPDYLRASGAERIAAARAG
jgi:tRNA threonylcarbamoyladenosine biosynthesis protein TsaB